MLSNDAGHCHPEEKSGRILVVDDEADIRQSLLRLFRRIYDVKGAENGSAALALLAEEEFDLIISDMRMPGMSGAELLTHCYDRYPAMGRVLLTGYADLESTISAINQGHIHRYVAKPWDNDELKQVVAEVIDIAQLKQANDRLNGRIIEQNHQLERLNQELQQRVDQQSEQVGESEKRLQQANRSLHQEFNSMVHILTGLIEARLAEPPGSSEKLARLAKAFAEFSGLSGPQIQDVYYAALLKNFGKVSLSDAVISRSLSQLSATEKREFAHFSIHGQTALMLLEPLQNAANIIRSHTELYNGRGFPDRLTGEAIPIEARILRIVSDYSELQREHNFLGEKLSEANARVYLLKMASQRYDRELVDTFMQVLDDFEELVAPHSERIAIDEAKPGMILADNLYSPSGAVLLSAGAQLSAHHIEKLFSIQREFSQHRIVLHVVNPDAHQQQADPG